MANSAKDVQRRRLAHRLHAVYIAEMSGKGQVDPLFRQLREKEPLKVFEDLSELILPIFHDIFIAQMDDSPGNRVVKEMEALREFNPKDKKPN